jgi:hypothetical protein
MVTASGSDKFHGQAFEFLRNHAFDARSYFNTYPDPVDSLRYNQYGGSIGGPIGHRTTEGVFDDAVLVWIVVVTQPQEGMNDAVQTTASIRVGLVVGVTHKHRVLRREAVVDADQVLIER